MLAESPIDVLLADTAGSSICEAIAKDLRKKGLTVACVDDSALRNHEPAYIKLLLSRIEVFRPRMVMPVFRPEAVARHLPEICSLCDSAGIPRPLVPLDTVEKIHLLDSKVQASELADRLGIRQPRLYGDDELSEVRYPAVFKRDSGLSGSGVYFPKTEKALSNLVRASGKKPHLVMDFVEGYDVCVDAIRWNGFFRAWSYKVILPKMKGISFLRKSIDAPELVDKVRRILDAVDYKGACGVDFRIDSATGKAYFLECNPRFSGGIKSELASGFDEPYILWQLAVGETPADAKLRSGRITVDWKPLLAHIFHL